MGAVIVESGGSVKGFPGCESVEVGKGRAIVLVFLVLLVVVVGLVVVRRAVYWKGLLCPVAGVLRAVGTAHRAAWSPRTRHRQQCLL